MKPLRSQGAKQTLWQGVGTDRTAELRRMGNALSEGAEVIRGQIGYVLRASDADEPWRYPRQDFQLMKMFMAQDMETIVEIVFSRTLLLCEYLKLAGWCLWREMITIFHTVDDVLVELIGMYDRTFVGAVEFGQRLQERIPCIRA